MDQDELEQVSELLIGLSRAELLALYERINNKAEFVDYLGESLGAAISKASDTDSFKQSMAPVVAAGVLKTARQEPMEMGKAIAPALGPAIRGMITLALENMSQRIDAHIKTNFSIQGFKWRIESSRTGVPLVDIVLRETLDFRVEHIMLIHQETGTLLRELSQPDIKTKDPAVVSSMLSAVSDFVVDAFGATNSSDEPQQYKVGDLTAYVEKLGDLAIAAVVRGTLTSSFKQLLRERLETICLVFGEKAHNFDGELALFDGSDSMLKDCLVSVAKKDDVDDSKKKSLAPFFFLAVSLFVFLFVGLGYQFWQSHKERARFEEFTEALSSLSGTALISALQGDPTEIRMLFDPFAENPLELGRVYGYSDSEIDWQLIPYSSPHPDLVEKRIEQLIEIPDLVIYQFEDGRLMFSGKATDVWVAETELQLAKMNGIEEVDFSKIESLTEELIDLVANEIQSTQIYFAHADVIPNQAGMKALELLELKLVELEKLLEQSAKRYELFIHINPIDLSENEERDFVRSLKRVDFVEGILNRSVSMGDIIVSADSIDNKLPYGLLEVKIKE